VPLVIVTSRPNLMGALVNRRATTIAGAAIAAIIISLNVFLLYDTFLG
jgi:manganese transport protein